jgi:hypothetical protein
MLLKRCALPMHATVDACVGCRTGPWLEIFTAPYVLIGIGIGILVEVARRLAMGLIAAREELRTAKAAAKAEESVGSSRP